jgi:hypothetical protein
MNLVLATRAPAPSGYLAVMRKVLFSAALSLAAFAGCSKSDKPPATSEAEAEANLPAMTVDEVDRAIAAKEAQAVDCNSDLARKRAGVVPGAILVSDHKEFAASELPADKNVKLVFYCANTS